MKTPIRTVVLFADEYQIYRGTKCRIYPAGKTHGRRMKLINILWASGKVILCKEAFWDVTYEIKRNI